MYEIDVECDFSAAHCLKGYQGNCARLHGHNWLVQIWVRVGDTDDVGIAVDFRRLKKELKEIVDQLDHSNLNELPFFRDVNPTSELLAKFVFDELSKRFNDQKTTVRKVRVCESPGSGASYFIE